MSFINFLNYKKYIGRSTDAQAARIGHVNAAYKDLKPTVGSVTQIESIEAPVELNTLSGRIELAGPLVTIIGNQFANFRLINSNITANSVIILQVAGSNISPANNPFAFSVISTIEDGGCDILVGLSENGQIIQDPVIHFLILNP